MILIRDLVIGPTLSFLDVSQNHVIRVADLSLDPKFR